VTAVTVALVDYGAGNLRSVTRALRVCGAEVHPVRTPDALQGAAAVVVPGVGHFDMLRALDGEWRAAVLRRVDAGAALLGICLGMQWLFEGSEEAPGLAGLGALPGSCRRLTARGDLKVPHVGWNRIVPVGDRDRSRLLATIPAGAAVYFTHAYAAPIGADTRAVATHGEPFAAVVERGRVAGVQFHPEKSGAIGLRILANFVQAAAERPQC
jgi:glutamine amidotransferase